jgi:hypothetical protein
MKHKQIKFTKCRYADQITTDEMNKVCDTYGTDKKKTPGHETRSEESQAHVTG